MTFWYGGVHPVESWVGYLVIGLGGIITGCRLIVNNPKLAVSKVAAINIIFIIFYLAYQLNRPLVVYYAIQNLTLVVAGIITISVIYYNRFLRERLDLIVYFLITIGIATSAYAVYQYLSESGYVLWSIKPSLYKNRYGSVFFNPNHHASFLTGILPFLLVIATSNRRSVALKILFGILAFIVIFATTVTMSRGGWIAMVFGSISALFLRYYRGSRVLILSLTAAILICSLIVYKYSGSVRSRVDSISVADTADSGMFRFWLWQSAVEIWNDNKIGGIGPGQFQVIFPRYRPATIPNNPEYTHNQYLEIIVEYGVAGFILLAALFQSTILVPVFKNAKNLLNRTNEVVCFNDEIIIGCVGSIISLLAHIFFDFSLRIPSVLLVFCSILAINKIISERFQCSESVLGAYLVRGKLAGLVIVLMSLAVSFSALKAACEGIYIKKAENAGFHYAIKLENLYSASKIEPGNPITQFRIAQELKLIAKSDKKNQYKYILESAKFASNSIKLDPIFPKSRILLGECLESIGDKEGARLQYQSAYINGKNDINIINDLTRSLIAEGDQSSAIKLVEESIKINWWDNPEAYYFKSLIEQDDK
jgi:O-antigen ligase